MTKQSSTTLSSRRLAAAYLGAAALTAVGGLASSPLTQAAPPMPLSPPCTQWQFTGNMPISQGNGQRIDVPWQGTQVGGGLVNSFESNGEKQHIGTPHGGVSGNNIDFTVNWDGTVGPGHYTANINNDGAVVLGVTTDSQNHRLAHRYQIHLCGDCGTAPGCPAGSGEPARTGARARAAGDQRDPVVVRSSAFRQHHGHGYELVCPDRKVHL
jgi:hypothetical protein